MSRLTIAIVVYTELGRRLGLRVRIPKPLAIRDRHITIDSARTTLERYLLQVQIVATPPRRRFSKFVTLGLQGAQNSLILLRFVLNMRRLLLLLRRHRLVHNIRLNRHVVATSPIILVVERFALPDAARAQVRPEVDLRRRLQGELRVVNIARVLLVIVVDDVLLRV